MKIIGISENDLINYKEIVMYIGFPYCSFKCNKECGENVCQNYQLQGENVIEISADELVKRYINNNLQKAIVFSGLEPFDSWEEMKELIRKFRNVTDDDIVIYSGYTYTELADKIYYLKNYKNIIIKFGRFLPNHQKHYDEVLGVELASDNQYAEKIS